MLTIVFFFHFLVSSLRFTFHIGMLGGGAVHGCLHKTTINVSYPIFRRWCTTQRKHARTSTHTTGNQELQPLNAQINKRETGNNRTWSATSIVQIPATRERHGETIKCVAIHESYAAKSLSVDAKLDVKCKYCTEIFNCTSQTVFSSFFVWILSVWLHAVARQQRWLPKWHLVSAEP